MKIDKKIKGKKEAAGPSIADKKKVKKKGKEGEKKEKGKKVFESAGQKYEAPEERDPLRIFYETLRDQRPDSEMAEFWMMEHGLLSDDEAREAVDRKQKRVEQIRRGGPGAGPIAQPRDMADKKKVLPPPASSNGKTTNKLKKKADDGGGDNDFDMSIKKKKMKK